MALSDQERGVLDIEGRGIRYLGDKERVIKDELGISAIRHFQILNRLRTNPEAWDVAGATLAGAQQRLRNEQALNRRSTQVELPGGNPQQKPLF